MRDKEVTIYDLARLSYFSPATVSRALRDEPCIHEETKRKIIEIAAEIGYRPNNFASSLRRNKTNLIGVLLDDLNDRNIVPTLNSIQQVLSDAGYDIIISNSGGSVQKEIAGLSHLFNKRVDGLIVLSGCQYDNISLYSDFVQKQIPIVVFDQSKLAIPCINISIDNYKAGYSAAVHLINKGCRNILHLTGQLSRPMFAERWQGFQAALSDFNLPHGSEQLMLTEFTEVGCGKSAQRLLKLKKTPDGVFVSCDLGAAICVQTFINAGLKVPDDVKILGFNNDIASRISNPQLSTFSYPGSEMGILAAKHLLRYLRTKSAKSIRSSVVLTAELIARETTG